MIHFRTLDREERGGKMVYEMASLASTLIVLILCLQMVVAPPVRRKEKLEAEKTIHADSANETLAKNEAQDQEYFRYLTQVVQELEKDPHFKEKLANASEEDLKSGKIAEHVDLLEYNVREKLDEVKRLEVEYQRDLLRQKRDHMSGLDRNYWNPIHHENKDTFERDDLVQLLSKHNDMMTERDKTRHQEFKKYELEKEHKRRERIKNMTKDEQKAQEKKHEDENHKKHEKLHEPGHKAQLEEVWEKEDGLDPDSFDSRTFFNLHDKNSDAYLDQFELETLFLTDLDKAYNESDPDTDMHERTEEMERMREHVMKNMDTDKDGLVSLDEFMKETKTDDFEKDDEWKPIIDEDQFTDDELTEYERMMAEEERLAEMHGEDDDDDDDDHESKEGNIIVEGNMKEVEASKTNEHVTVSDVDAHVKSNDDSVTPVAENHPGDTKKDNTNAETHHNTGHDEDKNTKEDVKKMDHVVENNADTAEIPIKEEKPDEGHDTHERTKSEPEVPKEEHAGEHTKEENHNQQDTLKEKIPTQNEKDNGVHKNEEDSHKQPEVVESPPKTTNQEPETLNHVNVEHNAKEEVSKEGTLNENSPTKKVAPNENTPNKEGTPNENTPNKEGTPNENTPNKEVTPNENTTNKEMTPNENTPNKEGTPNENTPNKEVTPNENTPNKEGTPNENTPNKEVTPNENTPNKEMTPNENTPNKKVTHNNEEHISEQGAHKEDPPNENTQELKMKVHANEGDGSAHNSVSKENNDTNEVKVASKTVEPVQQDSISNREVKSSNQELNVDHGNESNASKDNVHEIDAEHPVVL